MARLWSTVLLTTVSTDPRRLARPPPQPSPPLPPMAWLWSNVLALTTSVAAGPTGPPLRMAPPTPAPGRIALELSLPPMAWLWRNVLPVTVRLPEFWMPPPEPVASRLPEQLLPP